MVSYSRRIDTTIPSDVYNKAKALNIAWNDALIRGINEIARMQTGVISDEKGAILGKKDAILNENCEIRSEKQGKAIEFLNKKVLDLQNELDKLEKKRKKR